MIEIPLIADVYFPKGETPVLEFESIRQVEKFVADVQNRIDVIKGRKKERLEFFGDGIYFDGKPLKLRGRKYAILKAFEFENRVNIIDLIYFVWNDGFVNNKTVFSTISQFNKMMIDKGLFIDYQDGFFILQRP